MALIFECIHTEGIAELSYLLGDTAEGVAAVFDPRPDVDCYLQLARAKQLAITHIFETHIHVDFVSGARELCARAESATIFLSHEGGAQYGFDHEMIKDGDIFRFGSLLLTVKHAPGHTPELVAFLLADAKRRYYPWGCSPAIRCLSIPSADLIFSAVSRIKYWPGNYSIPFMIFILNSLIM